MNKKSKFKDENPSCEDSIGQLDENFWKDVALPAGRKKKSFKKKLGNFLAVVLIFVSGFAIAMITARGNGWLAQFVSGGKHIDFTLPTEDKPDNDQSLRQSDGRYTAEGLAETFSSSVVVIDVYSKKNELMPSGQGSGVIISKNGYIVTNAHVVEGGSHIRVVLNDNIAYYAELVGSEPENDIAVVKIEANNLHPASFGKSSQANLGEEVLTIGNPGGYEGSVTKGIISGINRAIRLESGIIYNCIQVDAAINPGNSGGALFNMWGQVIGITSSKLNDEKYDGIGFAISSDTVKPVVERIMSGKVKEPELKIGITYFCIDKQKAEEGNVVPGLYVESISDDCPVAKSGLSVGDIITKIDGKSALEIKDLKSYLQKKGEGGFLECEIVRYDDKGKKTSQTVKIEIVKDKSMVEK